MRLLLFQSLFLACPLVLAQDPRPDTAAHGHTPGIALPPGTLTLDPTDTVLYAVTGTRGLAEMLAHEHVLRATDVTGVVTWDPTGRRGCSFEVSLSVEALRIDAPSDRRMASLDGDLSDNDRAQVRDKLLGEDQLAAKEFPTITFTSTACSGSGSTATLQGDLTLHGQTDRVSVPLIIESTATGLRAVGSLTILQSRFGIEPYSAVLGAISVDDAVRLHFDLHAR
jgi:polyisoprenoid-binding protein YceI